MPRTHERTHRQLLELAALELGYNGKFLLLSVYVDGSPDLTFVRGGDEWHREILHSAEQELQDLGFAHHPRAMGGAWVRIDADEIEIWGASEEFGVCDKQLAGSLLSRAFPDRPVRIG